MIISSKKGVVASKSNRGDIDLEVTPNTVSEVVSNESLNRPIDQTNKRLNKVVEILENNGLINKG